MVKSPHIVWTRGVKGIVAPPPKFFKFKFIYLAVFHYTARLWNPSQFCRFCVTCLCTRNIHMFWAETIHAILYYRFVQLYGFSVPQLCNKRHLCHTFGKCALGSAKVCHMTVYNAVHKGLKSLGKNVIQE